MNFSKKLFCITFLILILSVTAAASTNEASYVYYYPEESVTIEFPVDSALSDEFCKAVADSIVYNTPLPQTYSLCWLVGHDTSVKTITAVYHEKSEYDPRCQLEVYEVTICSNCDYTYPVLKSSQYISCCPPEASAVSLD